MTKPASIDFSESNVRAWMRRNARNHVDDCGEVNATSLAESAAGAFDVDGVDGPLDDPDHWIWDLAIEHVAF